MAKRLILLILSVSLGLLTQVNAQTQNPVTVTLESYIVSEVTLDDGSTEERFTLGTQARPGQLIEYRLLAMNTSDESLPGGNLMITGPVPEGTTYQANSASLPPEAATLTFSVDGETFAAEPVVLVTNAEGVQEEVAALPETFVAVRWAVSDVLEPGESLEFSYRVVVN